MKQNGLLIYFGAAGSGISYSEHAGKLPDFFIDNDPNKWGTKVKGIKVQSPEILGTVSIKKIIITSGYMKEIYKQLIDLNINPEIIHSPPKALLGRYCFTISEDRVKIASKLSELFALTEPKCSLVAVGGTALGFVREKDFIRWDSDIDLFAPISAKVYILDILNQMGLEILEDELDGVMHSIKSVFKLENGLLVPFSIDFFDGENDFFIDIFEDYSWNWPTEMFTNCKKIKILGFDMNVPNPPEKYLAGIYGVSWQEPNPEFDYSDYAGKVTS